MSSADVLVFVDSEGDTWRLWSRGVKAVEEMPAGLFPPDHPDYGRVTAIRVELVNGRVIWSAGWRGWWYVRKIVGRPPRRAQGETPRLEAAGSVG